MSFAGLSDKEEAGFSENERLRNALSIAKDGLRSARSNGFDEATNYLDAIDRALRPPPDPIYAPIGASITNLLSRFWR